MRLGKNTDAAEGLKWRRWRRRRRKLMVKRMEYLLG